MVDLVDKTNDAAGNTSGNLVAGASEASTANVDPVSAADAPSDLDFMDAFASLLENLGLHHNPKFGGIVEKIRAHQRSIAERSSAN